MDKKQFGFTNSAGERFKLLPMNPLEEQVINEQVRAEWKAAGKTLPDFPTYTVTTVTGETQQIPIRRKEEATTAELQAAWAAYEAARDAFAQQVGDRLLTSAFLCVNENPDDFPRWKMRMKLLQIPIPEDEGDKFLLFCKTWVIRTTEDITGLIFAAAKTAVNISEEAERAAEEMFRRAMEKASADLQAGGQGG